MSHGSRYQGVALWCMLAALSVVPLWAQQGVGALYGTVIDTAGGRLPGAALTLSGFGELKTQSSDERGQFRFLGLDPGTWSLQASLDGFSTVDFAAVTIEASRNSRLEVVLTAAIEEVVTVTAETPLLDERKLSTGTTLRQVELEKLPIARDPWAVLTQSPGVLIGRIDVAGASGTRQPVFRGLAASSLQNDYVQDGMQITMFGGAATYFDIDQFEELQVLTGGNDVTKNSSGVSISLVTKRGSNEMRGSGRFLLTEGDGYFGVLEQAESGFDPEELGPGQEEFVGDSIDGLLDYGFEAGGPAWRNHVWMWGAWSQRDFSTVTGSNDPELIILENSAIKINAQLSRANSLVASYNYGDKLAFGRGAGQNVDRSGTLDQRGPTGITKVEDSHVFGSNLFLTGSYGYIDGGFDITAVGGAGPDQPPTPEPGGEVNIDASGFRTNGTSFSTSAPIEELKLDGSYFLNTGGLSHELRFGGRLREFNEASVVSYPGRNLLHYAGSFVGVQDPGLLAAFGLPPERFEDAHLVYAYRGGAAPKVVDSRGLWLQDTITWSRWTVNVALRYDDQDGENLPATVAANGGFPELMPAIEFSGNDGGGLSWQTLAPRLGVTYALGQDRKTLLRGSLSQFPDAFSHDLLARSNPLRGQYASILFLDEPGGFSGFYDDGETFAVLGGLFGFDPSNPTAVPDLTDLTDPDLKPGLLTELVVGVEHAFLPEFVAGFSLTWRRNDRIVDRQPLFEDLTTGEVRTASADEYRFDGTVDGELPDGSPYSWDTYAINPSLSPLGDTLLTNGDRTAESSSVAVTLTKRLSNRWMARGFFNYIFKEEWNVPSSYFEHNDPNRTGRNIDGKPFDESGYISSWQWNLNGMYQVSPERWWGFNVAANLTGRQGYPNRYIRRVRGSDRVFRGIMVVDDPRDFRKSDVVIVDLRLEKEFAATGDTSLTFSVDGFNLLNEGYVLGRNTDLGSPRADWVAETLSPRIYRLGVRINWR